MNIVDNAKRELKEATLSEDDRQRFSKQIDEAEQGYWKSIPLTEKTLTNIRKEIASKYSQFSNNAEALNESHRCIDVQLRNYELAQFQVELAQTHCEVNQVMSQQQSMHLNTPTFFSPKTDYDLDPEKYMPVYKNRALKILLQAAGVALVTAALYALAFPAILVSISFIIAASLLVASAAVATVGFGLTTPESLDRAISML